MDADQFLELLTNKTIFEYTKRLIFVKKNIELLVLKNLNYLTLMEVVINYHLEDDDHLEINLNHLMMTQLKEIQFVLTLEISVNAMINLIIESVIMSKYLN